RRTWLVPTLRALWSLWESNCRLSNRGREPPLRARPRGEEVAVERVIPFLTIDLHQQEYKGVVAEYDRKCGGGETANQFNNGIVAAESEQGLAVDLTEGCRKNAE